MQFVIPILVLATVILPLAMIWRIWRRVQPTRLSWLFRTVEAALAILLILLVTRWDMAGVYARWVLLLLLVLAIALSARRHWERPWRETGASIFASGRWKTLLSVGALCGVLGYVLAGMMGGDGARQLSLPLRDGWFMVAQGGGNFLLNHHSDHRAQRYAADIVALTGWGFRAQGVLPEDPAAYAAFEAPVVSPCDGSVVEARDGLPDLRPPASDRANAAGNHVVIDCGAMLVELAHLREGSIVASPGDGLAVGDPIGKVGNSGNTTEPHLHIHAVDPINGEGVQIAFDGEMPVRNRTFRR